VGGAEPGVEGIFVAVIGNAADLDFGEINAGVEDPFGCFGGFGLVEHWDGDTPRDLAGNVPIFQAFEIIDEDFLLGCRVEGDLAGFKMFNGGFGETLDVDKPLRFEHWLDDGTTFITMSDGVGDVFGAAHEAG